jgi:hypothetical protein
MVRPAARPDQPIDELELFRPLQSDRLVDDLGAGARPLVGFLDLAIRKRRLSLLALNHLLSV